MNYEKLINNSLDIVKKEYIKSDRPWMVGFSGGKDSSLIVKIIFEVLSQQQNHNTPINIIYCDTGVEIPLISIYVKRILKNIQIEANQNNLPIKCHIAKPPLKDKFFVRLIGRGYAPPSNKFRWCTDKLRINPVKKLIDRLVEPNSIIVLGVRNYESEERNRILKKHSTNRRYFYRQSNSKQNLLFCPIVNFNTDSVWEGLCSLEYPTAINVNDLALLYKQAGGECPIIRDVKGTPCGHGRFGCWTCTVVRKDKAVMGLVNEGHTELEPLLKFRNWLLEIRDDINYRCSVRRNGVHGLGPFRISARKKILQKLKEAEKKSGLNLIGDDEIREIFKLWKIDRISNRYAEDL